MLPVPSLSLGWYGFEFHEHPVTSRVLSIAGMFLLKQQSHTSSLHPGFWSLSIWEKIKKDLKAFMSFTCHILLLSDVFAHLSYWPTLGCNSICDLCLEGQLAPLNAILWIWTAWRKRAANVLHSTRGLEPTWGFYQLFIRLTFTYSSNISLIITAVPKMMADFSCSLHGTEWTAEGFSLYPGSYQVLLYLFSPVKAAPLSVRSRVSPVMTSLAQVALSSNF